MSYLQRTDTWLVRFNFLWLLLIIVIPAITKLLTVEGGDSETVHAIRWSMYATAQVLLSLSFLVLVRRAASHDLSHEMPAGLIPNETWQAIGICMGFGLSVPLFFVTKDAWLLWIVLPRLVGRTHSLIKFLRR